MHASPSPGHAGFVVVPPVPPLEVVPPADVVPPVPPDPPVPPLEVVPPDPPVLPPEPPPEELPPESPQATRRAPQRTTKGRENFASMGACSLFARRESRDSSPGSRPHPRPFRLAPGADSARKGGVRKSRGLSRHDRQNIEGPGARSPAPEKQPLSSWPSRSSKGGGGRSLFRERSDQGPAPPKAGERSTDPGAETAHDRVKVTSAETWRVSVENAARQTASGTPGGPSRPWGGPAIVEDKKKKPAQLALRGPK